MSKFLVSCVAPMSLPADLLDQQLHIHEIANSRADCASPFVIGRPGARFSDNLRAPRHHTLPSCTVLSHMRQLHIFSVEMMKGGRTHLASQ